MFVGFGSLLEHIFSLLEQHPKIPLPDPYSETVGDVYTTVSTFTLERDLHYKKFRYPPEHALKTLRATTLRDEDPYERSTITHLGCTAELGSLCLSSTRGTRFRSTQTACRLRSREGATGDNAPR